MSFKSNTGTIIDRAINELRTGRPLIIQNNKEYWMFFNIEHSQSKIFNQFNKYLIDEKYLLITKQKAQSIFNKNIKSNIYFEINPKTDVNQIINLFVNPLSNNKVIKFTNIKKFKAKNFHNVCIDLSKNAKMIPSLVFKKINKKYYKNINEFGFKNGILIFDYKDLLKQNELICESIKLVSSAKVPLPKKGESKKAILETYTKEYSAEYQSQALIDLAKKLKTKIPNLNLIKKIDIFTSHHTHYVIGTGANDPQKMDPNASRETLDHSIMYIFAVALEDGSWHHVKSYSKARAKRKSTIKIWRSIKTHEDKKWTKRYHDPNPRKKAFGAKVTITLKNGKKITEEQGVADAHPYGSRPFKRKNYINKFLTLTENILDKKEIERFLKTVQNLRKLKSGQLDRLNIIVKKSKIKRNLKKGIF